MSTYNLQPNISINRIPILDALRGFAILGIFIVNIKSFTFSYDISPLEATRFPLASYDRSTSLLIALFFEGKFYSIFSLLFGIGFSIYLSKPFLGKHILSLFKRRLLILLFIGIIHMILWQNDTLALYALLGFLLVPFNRFNNRNLLIIAGICILSPILWDVIEINYPKLSLNNYLMYKAGLVVRSKNNYFVFVNKIQRSFLYRVHTGLYNIYFRSAYILASHRIWKVFGMFLIGAVIGRTKIYNRLQENQKLLLYVFILGIIIGLPANYFRANIEDDYLNPNSAIIKRTIAFAVGVAPLSLAYCSLFSLLFINPVIRKILNVFSSVGKMALTNYIMQTFIGLFVFSDFGLGVHYLGVTQLFIFAIVIFISQIIISDLWLRFFNYGPLEWLWRSATYREILAMRKKTEYRQMS
jgi:uncharacterized protein